MATSAMRDVQGTLEAFDAASRGGNTDQLEDMARNLSDSVAGMLEDVGNTMEAQYQSLLGDKEVDSEKLAGMREAIDQFKRDAGQFAPRLGVDPDRPNPMTQPAGNADSRENPEASRTADEQKRDK